MLEDVDVVIVGFLGFGTLHLIILKEGPASLAFRLSLMSHEQCFVLFVVGKAHQVRLQMVEADCVGLLYAFEEMG